MALHVPARRINEIVLGKRGVTADTALRLSRYFGTSPQFWLGLQMDYELDVAEDSLEGRIEKRSYSNGCHWIRGTSQQLQTRLLVQFVKGVPQSPKKGSEINYQQVANNYL
jgi:hypothetical protein